MLHSMVDGCVHALCAEGFNKLPTNWNRLSEIKENSRRDTCIYSTYSYEYEVFLGKSSGFISLLKGIQPAFDAYFLLH